jgi:hypothetical protein
MKSKLILNNYDKYCIMFRLLLYFEEHILLKATIEI